MNEQTQAQRVTVDHVREAIAADAAQRASADSPKEQPAMTTETAATTHEFNDGAGPVPAHRHPYGGGWVANTAYVAPTAYVGPRAQVYGRAQVLDRAEVLDQALVYDSARVYGDARVEDQAQVCGGALVCGMARVRGTTVIRDAPDPRHDHHGTSHHP